MLEIAHTLEVAKLLEHDCRVLKYYIANADSLVTIVFNPGALYEGDHTKQVTQMEQNADLIRNHLAGVKLCTCQECREHMVKTVALWSSKEDLPDRMREYIDMYNLALKGG